MTQPPEPVPGAPTEPTTTPPAPPADPTPPADPGQDPNAPVDIASLPPNVQNLIKTVRGEAAKERTSAKERAAAEAKAELLAQISQSLGMTEAPTDPAVLTERLAQSEGAIADADGRAASAELELDVFKKALALGADPMRLLDSRQFASEVDALEDDGFADALKALITARLEADPSLRLGGAPAATPANRQPVAALRPGALPQQGEPTLLDLIAEAQKAGDVREVIRLKQFIPRKQN